MKSSGLSKLTRWLLIICGICLLAILFLPIWRIELDAPQYPEGLQLNIYANGLRGNVDIINGLNHYIGMRTLHNQDFIEFTVLTYIILFFAVLYFAITLINKRKLLNAGVILFILFGIVAMIDFWRWEYNYGHNLNPDAAIRIPGMAYQPPLIGFKQLLNFGAYSIPDIGGWIFIGVGAMLVACFYIEFKKRKLLRSSYSLSIVVALAAMMTMSSCNVKPEAIVTGKDQCCFCKMTVSDPKFGAEIVTVKGRNYKFDDMHCVLAFINNKMLEVKEIKEVYLTDFASADHQLIKATEAALMQSEKLNSPMNGNIAAVGDTHSIQKLMEEYQGTSVSWKQLVK